MTRDLWEDRLSEYVDGELEPSDRVACERHLAACAACRQSLADLRSLVAQAPSLKRPAPPAQDLWPGVAARLQPRSSRWWATAGTGTRRPWLAPGLAAAAVLVLVCLAGFLWFRTPTSSVQRVAGGARSTTAHPLHHDGTPADIAYEDLVAGLRRSAQARLTADPQVVNVLEDNLSALDRAIAEYQDALAESPRDGELERRLAEARQRKLELLRQAAAAPAEGTN